MFKMESPASLSIVACGPSAWQYIARGMVECGRPTDKVWAINRMGLMIDCDIIFAMDDRRWLKKHVEFGGAVDALEATGNLIITSVAYPEYPNTKPYPLEEVRLHFGNIFEPLDKLFDNSVNYALALAIARGYDPIWLYGYGFYDREDREYPEAKEGDPWWRTYYYRENQRAVGEPGIEATHFLIGWALAKGQSIFITQGSSIMNADRKPYLYGYHDD